MTPQPFHKVQRLHSERARLASRLSQIDRELRAEEEVASKALGFKVRVRGVQLLSAIERMGG